VDGRGECCRGGQLLATAARAAAPIDGRIDGCGGVCRRLPVCREGVARVRELLVLRSDGRRSDGEGRTTKRRDAFALDTVVETAGPRNR
jgi:hypothetical protein